MPTHTPELTRSAGREGLIPHFLWFHVKAPLSTTATADPAEALLPHHLSYNKKNHVHLLKLSSNKTTKNHHWFYLHLHSSEHLDLTIFTNIQRHCLQLQLVPLQCMWLTFHRETRSAVVRLYLTFFAQDFGRRCGVTYKTVTWAKMECVIYGAYNL